MAKSDYFRTYNLSETTKHGHDPVAHQHRALGEMEKRYRSEQSGQNFGGLLVLPTGGGKSFVGTYFLCGRPLSDGYRVLWLAHTHHLLKQAQKSFDNTMWRVDKSRKKIDIRVVSGATGHFKPAHIKSSDDILLCSLQTARGALEKQHPKFMDFLEAANGGGGPLCCI